MKNSLKKPWRIASILYFNVERFLVMDEEKKMTLVLTLSDIAEGLNTAIEALKLIANGLDDVANLLRDTVKGEDAERNENL